LHFYSYKSLGNNEKNKDSETLREREKAKEGKKNEKKENTQA